MSNWIRWLGVGSLLTLAIVTEGGEAKRTYHPVELWEVPVTVHTHACVTGTVALVKREADGDLHVRLEDGQGHFIVAEEIPKLTAPGPRPKVGATRTACGIVREDKKHGWHEIHPVERWK